MAKKRKRKAESGKPEASSVKRQASSVNPGASSVKRQASSIKPEAKENGNEDQDLERRCITCNEVMSTRETARNHRNKGHEVMWVDLDTGERFKEKPKHNGTTTITSEETAVEEKGKGKPALVFIMGQEKLELQTLDMFHAYEHYIDLQEQCGWDADFSSSLRVGMRLLRALVSSSVRRE